ncbi:MAG: hypothetical protein IH624_10145 [Phycisphaerae bacterium]|nr:hypothetical protein [Phycisphaerae bacterium]
MNDKCEICQGKVEYGVCLVCGLLDEDYLPEEDMDEENAQEGGEDDMLLKPR